MSETENRIFTLRYVSLDSQALFRKEPSKDGIVEKYQDEFNAWLRKFGIIKPEQVANLTSEPFLHEYSNGSKSDAIYYFDDRVNNHHVFLSELKGMTTKHFHAPPTLEHYILLEGEAEVTIDKETCHLNSQRRTLIIPSGKEHQVMTTEGQRAVLLIIMINPPPQRENLHSFRGQ